VTSRRLKGLDAIAGAAVEAAPAIHVLILDGIPRTGLTVTEVAEITRLSRDRIYDEIHAGRIAVIRGGSGYIIPVSQLAAIESWAERLDPTA
jgi:excisionase family DNA binding protein